MVAIGLGLLIRIEFLRGGVLRQQHWFWAFESRVLPFLFAIFTVQAVVIVVERQRFGRAVAFGLGRWTLLFGGGLFFIRILAACVREFEWRYFKNLTDPMFRPDAFLLDQIGAPWSIDGLPFVVLAAWLAWLITRPVATMVLDMREVSGRVIGALIIVWSLIVTVVQPLM